MGWNAIMELRHACMIKIVPTLFNARSNPWDHNGTTTFMFDSPNMWNVICTAPRDWRIHARTMFGSWSDRARVVEWCCSCFKKISFLFWSVIFCGGRRIWRRCRVNPVALCNFQPFSQKNRWYFGASFFVAGAVGWWSWTVAPVAALNANDVPAVFHKILCFVSWQAQYLVILDGVSCCSVQCKTTLMPFSAQKPLLLQSHFLWQAQYLGMLQGDYFSRSPRAFCMEKCTILRSGSLWILPTIAPATNSDSWIHQILQLPWKLNMQVEFSFIKYCVQLECHFTKYCECHEKCTSLLHYHSFNCFLWLYYFLKIYNAFALPFFDATFFYSTILWFYFSFTLLFLDSSMLLPVSLTLLIFYSTILWLY